ncbi:hypothetical protein SISSUDRAFT_1067300 [Sistotremastrum suecicum HHB10207 ss-3]|uniref:Uncharacterized protein n=1 Tax=Sistotremastrum suecicum HHB10207 ss-3 TaxID=1314776 RepID=A0A165X9Q3_9AGAM|nr:hypothetical protein SISSUDRAFT_1067300 [Sistotremastrum suecicum HHB10207 ss-3]
MALPAGHKGGHKGPTSAPRSRKVQSPRQKLSESKAQKAQKAQKASSHSSSHRDRRKSSRCTPTVIEYPSSLIREVSVCRRLSRSPSPSVLSFFRNLIDELPLKRPISNSPNQYSKDINPAMDVPPLDLAFSFTDFLDDGANSMFYEGTSNLHNGPQMIHGASDHFPDSQTEQLLGLLPAPPESEHSRNITARSSSTDSSPPDRPPSASSKSPSGPTISPPQPMSTSSDSIDRSAQHIHTPNISSTDAVQSPPNNTRTSHSHTTHENVYSYSSNTSSSEVPDQHTNMRVAQSPSNPCPARETTMDLSSINSSSMQSHTEPQGNHPHASPSDFTSPRSADQNHYPLTQNAYISGSLPEQSQPAMAPNYNYPSPSLLHQVGAPVLSHSSLPLSIATAAEAQTIANAYNIHSNSAIAYPNGHAGAYPAHSLPIDRPSVHTMPHLMTPTFSSSLADPGTFGVCQNDMFRMQIIDAGSQLSGQQPVFWQIPTGSNSSYVPIARNVNSGIYSLNQLPPDPSSFAPPLGHAFLRNSSSGMLDASQHLLVGSRHGDGMYTVVQSNHPSTNYVFSPFKSGFTSAPTTIVQSLPSITPVEWQSIAGSASGEPQLLVTAIPTATTRVSGSVYSVPAMVQPHHFMAFQHA